MFVVIGIVFFSLAIVSIGIGLFLKGVVSQMLSYLKESDSLIEDHEE